MKVFVYNPEHVWPSDRPRPGAMLRLDAETVSTTEPDDADFFIVPWPIYDYEYHKVDPRAFVTHLAGREERHCWLEIADCYADHKQLVGNGVFFTCNLNRERQAVHPNAIQIQWPVDDLGLYAGVPVSGIDFDVVFQGWNSCSQRAESAASVQVAGLRHHVQLYDEFFGYYHDTERGLERRKSYLETLQRSLVSLCPRSIPGVFPYRFFEAMSAARIPALVCSDFVLPCSDKILYDLFCIFIPDGDAARAGQVIGEWLSGKSQDDVLELGRLARASWVDWLDSHAWPRIMRRLLEDKLKEQCHGR